MEQFRRDAGTVTAVLDLQHESGSLRSPLMHIPLTTERQRHFPRAAGPYR